MDKSFFYKKFSVGIALNTTEEEFESFLKQYAPYIDNCYGSLPLGDKFHGREYIAKQFQDPENVEKFWKIAKLVNQYNVNLEIVFNTEGLDKADIDKCRIEVQKREIQVDKIAVLDCYYQDIKENFPEVQIIHSVHHMGNTREEILEISNPYNEIVVGRQFIRDAKLFRGINEKGIKTVLLLNNGCSHVCGGCRSHDYCRAVYENGRKKTSPQYLYAMQSIMPYELHEEYFDLTNVQIFKLSTRNADTEFICKCIDSYIHNNARDYVEKSCHHYLLWARLRWHIDYFNFFDYEEIKDIKREICGYYG